MKTVVLTLTPKRSVTPLIDALLEAGVAVAPDRPGELIVENDRANAVERFFQIHGYVVEKQERFLEGALDCISEFIRFENKEETTTKKKVETQVGRQKLITFLQRKIRETRKGRDKRRAQHVRDELSGKIRAYEDILRKLKKS
jgi:hypothetical protein